MSVSDDVLDASSDSFFEIDCYKRTVKRTEDGLHMCSELAKLILERADIEKEYAKKLKAWCKKWTEAIDKGTEYGTNKAILIGSLNEAESLGDVHLAIKDRLTEVQAELKQWRNENYKKQMVGGCKEAKTFEDDFKKAQKPWAKKLSKVMKAKKEHHTACKLERSLTVQLATDSTSDAGRKLKEKLDKCRKDVESTQEKYKESLSDLHKYNSMYVDDMTEVFTRTQEFEEKRLRFFKETMYGLHTCLDISQNKDIPVIYSQLRRTIEQSEASKDLKWWSQNHGPEMTMSWPTFEEYSIETSLPAGSQRKPKSVYNVTGGSEGSLNSLGIEKNGKSGGSVRQPSAAVRESVRQSVLVQQPAAVTTQVAPPPQRLDSYDTSLNPFADDAGSGDSRSVTVTTGVPVTMTTTGTAASDVIKVQNPFDDEDDDDRFDISNAVPVAVQAVYDYVGQEEDELSFKAGDKFEKLKDRDEQGWCTGRKDGRVGLFPDNYIKLITP